jgi:hypothetical protein
VILTICFIFGLLANLGAEGFFGLALGLVVHRCSLPSTALQTPRLLVGSADHIPDGDAEHCSGTLHLGEVNTQLLGLLLGCMRGVRLLLASAALVLAFALLASFFLLFISATAAGETAGQTAHGVRGLLCRSSRNLSCLVGHLPDLIRDAFQRSSAVLAFSLLVAHYYSFPSPAFLTAIIISC